MKNKKVKKWKWRTRQLLLYRDMYSWSKLYLVSSMFSHFRSSWYCLVPLNVLIWDTSCLPLDYPTSSINKDNRTINIYWSNDRLYIPWEFSLSRVFFSFLFFCGLKKKKKIHLTLQYLPNFANNVRDFLR